MSHFTNIETQIRDLDALRLACAELGLELSPAGEARGYGQNRLPGDFVIRLKGPYDLALQRQPEGSYRVVADFWGDHVEREVGPGCGRLKQLYGVHLAQTAARRRGYHIRRQDQPNGQIRLAITQV